MQNLHSITITSLIIIIILFLIFYIDIVKDCDEKILKQTEKWNYTSASILGLITFFVGWVGFVLFSGSKYKFIFTVIFIVIGFLIGLLVLTLNKIKWPDPIWATINRALDIAGLKDKNKMLFMIFLIIALSIFTLITILHPGSDKAPSYNYVALIIGIIQLILSFELFRFKNIFEICKSSDKKIFYQIFDKIFFNTPELLLICSIIVLFYCIGLAGLDNIIKILKDIK